MNIRLSLSFVAILMLSQSASHLMAGSARVAPVFFPDEATCECSDLSIVPDSDPVMLQTVCDLQWHVDVTYSSRFSASIDYEAGWTVSDSSVSFESKTEVNEYSCELEQFEVCEALGVEVVVPNHPAEASVDFLLRIKGSSSIKYMHKDMGVDAAKLKDPKFSKLWYGPREFIRTAAECVYTDN